MIAHHPSEATLARYGSASLAEALALVVATHLGYCAECRRVVFMLEATGGALLDTIAPVAMAGGALDAVMVRSGADVPPPASSPILHPGLPAPLNLVALRRWWPVGRGLRYRPLLVRGAAWGGLVLAQPTRSLPRHGHDGLELTCVLSGAFVDGSGVYRAGDLCEPGTDHDDPPRVVGPDPCLCIVASEGMRLRGLLGWAQRVIGA